ncbi:MAG: swr1 complex component [Vezdaea aestivalis]|nr:MAG: swr1 complex component [Vezdaea aestivalis]
MNRRPSHGSINESDLGCIAVSPGVSFSKPSQLTNGFTDDDAIVEQPRKRRKTSDSNAYRYQEDAGRPTSPPWRNAATDGPSTFVENGRRKSSRTNILPLDLLPPVEARKTRRSTGQSSKPSKSRYEGGAVNPPESPPQGPTTQYSRYGRQIRHSARKSRDESPSFSPPKPKAVVHEQVSEPSPVKRKPGRPKSQHRLSVDTRKMKVDVAGNTRKVKHARKSSRISNPSPTTTRSRRRSSNVNRIDSSRSIPSRRPPKLKFRIKMPELPLLSFHNLPRPRKYSSFRDWFENDPVVKEETNQISLEEVEREGHLRQRIIQESEPGGLLSKNNCSAYLPDREEEPFKQFGHFDHVVSQAIHFRLLMQAEHRRHVFEAKKLAQAAAAEVKRRTPKTAEEVEQESRDRILVAYKQVCRDLQRKWLKVADYINQQRLALWDEEQDLLQKQALDNVLEQSTRLLDARISTNALEVEMGDGTDEDADVESDADTSGDGLGSDSQDESNMSSSSGSMSDDGHSPNGPERDENLTVEDLRKKYQVAESRSGSSPSIDEWQFPNDGADDDFDFDFDMDLIQGKPVAQSFSRHHTRPNGYKDEILQNDGTDDAILDDSDESIDMDTGLEDSDEDDESDNESEGPGIQGFYDMAAGPSAPNAIQLEKGRAEVDLAASPSELGLKTKTSDPTLLLTNGDQDSAEHLDPSTRTSPGTVTTAKPSDPDSRSSLGFHDSRHSSSATTPQPVFSLKTPIPFLLRGSLREYQHYGLDWLSNLYANKTNGILADEMGLGKTIQTIALLAHLACEHQIWGPHLVIVPTSVMLNWEMEFKKWCPSFKILTYYGTQERRKELRKGWLNDDLWNVCITSYQLVIQDQMAFKRRNWHFMILDEAHHIKNFQSLKWQTLLTFKTVARLLLTGTPLQNGLEELWALLFFLMPTVQLSRIGEFASREEFQEWFREIKVQIVDKGADQLDPRAQAAVADLHKVLRPFLLRRLKADVEKQMPPKFEHIVDCRLSKRQRHLYDEFMSRGSTKDALIRGNAFSIMNCVMSLRKVCNHPDLFETRQIVTSYAMRKAVVADFEIQEMLIRRRLLGENSLAKVNLEYMGLLPVRHERFSKDQAERSHFLGALDTIGHLCRLAKSQMEEADQIVPSRSDAASANVDRAKRSSHLAFLESIFSRQWMHAQRKVIYGPSLIKMLKLPSKIAFEAPTDVSSWRRHAATPSPLGGLVLSNESRASLMEETLRKFAFVTPSVHVKGMNDLALTPVVTSSIQQSQQLALRDPFHEARIRLSIAFPDKRLLQYDCGKLQQLDRLLRELEAGGHRVLIFTQMTKVLDLLEQFMNIHGHRYLRLDGQTKIEQRQILTERFNSDRRILAFILSSRSGGLGINLTGADTVIFYDLDWNPSADKQCQDRCHRIGQTREVHIYRLVSESTIESNILRKANQKRMLDNVVIQEGDFTTDYFNKLSVRDMLGDDVVGLGDSDVVGSAVDRALGGSGDFERVLENVEDAEDVKAAKKAKSEAIHVDEADFAEKDATSKSSKEDQQGDRLASLDPSSVVRTNPTNGHILGNPEGLVEMPEPNHLDEFLIRYMEHELADIPLVVPLDRLRAKNKKNQHRVKRNK